MINSHNYARTSFLIGLAGIVFAIFSIYMVLKLSGHPLLNEGDIPTDIESRKAMGSKALLYGKSATIAVSTLAAASLFFLAKSIRAGEKSLYRKAATIGHVVIIACFLSFMFKGIIG